MSMTNRDDAVAMRAIVDPRVAQRIVRLARSGRLCALVASVVTVAGTGWYAQDAAHLGSLLHNLAPEVPFQLDSARWLPAAVVVIALSSLLVAMLLAAAAVFWHIGSGQLFSRATQLAFRRLGYLALAFSVSAIFGRTALTLILTEFRPASPPQLVISISGTDVLAVIFAILFFLLAQILSAAQAVANENEGFV